jgi:DNA-binding SARP family transcriptional activator/TolB-like protein
MAPLHVRLLGPLELRSADGAPIALPTRKAQALLARLAARPGEAVSRGELAGLLWADRPDEQGRASLRQALASIRRAAGDGAAALSAGGDAVALDPRAVEVDVARLEAALARGDAGLAAELHRGPFLDGFPPLDEPFDDWAEATRAGLARRALDAFRALLEPLAEPGDAAAGLALAERALALDPAFEPAWRARMRLLAARGERAAALREYERCRAAVARAVSAQPGPETERLLRELAAGDPGPRRAAGPGGLPTLAVLPFDVASSDATHDVFARGLAEDLLLALSRFRTLRVVARDSVARLAADGLGAAQIGRVLGAGHVLAATVRPGGGRLRIAARLVDSASEREAWAERFEADLADVFAVQERIAGAVAGALAIQLDAGALREATGRPPASLDAYACWLRGMQCVRSGTAEADLEGRRFFERALELDPGFARAHAGLSLSHFNDWSCVAWDRWDENERRAFEHAREALRLDERDHLAHLVLGRVLLYRREFDRAAEHLARSLALNENDADALTHLALGYGYLGEGERAVALAAAARRLNPFHPEWYFPCGSVGCAVLRRPGEAVELLERAPDGFVDTRAMMAACYAHLGDDARAAESGRRFLARFRGEIARDPRAGGDAALAWLLRVNPFRREEDRRWLADGLARAGLRA